MTGDSPQREVNDAGPITVSPDPAKLRERRARVPQRLRSIYDYIFVPAERPQRFATESLDDLSATLKTDDPEVAKALLAEAEAAFEEPHERIDGAERRATTLQGTVAVAGSVAAAAGGFLLDPNRIAGNTWRVGFALVLVGFVASLVGCAVRALGATSRVFEFPEPGFDRIQNRARMKEPEALTSRAAELLRVAAVADMVGSVKVGLLRAAAWWFRLALMFLMLLVLLICAYAVAGPESDEGGHGRRSLHHVRNHHGVG